MAERDIQNAIRVHISARRLATLFRANVGEAWTGERIERCADGAVKIYGPRRFITGLPNGFPDLFGLRAIEITPAMVGRTIAAFVFVEVKRPGKKPSKAQARMIDFLLSQGAAGGVARAPAEAERLLRGDADAQPDAKTGF